jgi:hypothetical protein
LYHGLKVEKRLGKTSSANVSLATAKKVDALPYKLG